MLFFILTRIISVINYLTTPRTYEGLVILSQYSEIFRILFSVQQGNFFATILSNLIPLVSFFVFGAALFYIVQSDKLRNWLKGGIIFVGSVQFILVFDIIYSSIKEFLGILIIFSQYINQLLWFPYDHRISSLSIKIILIVMYFLLLFLIGSFIGAMLKKKGR